MKTEKRNEKIKFVSTLHKLLQYSFQTEHQIIDCEYNRRKRTVEKELFVKQ